MTETSYGPTCPGCGLVPNRPFDNQEENILPEPGTVIRCSECDFPIMIVADGWRPATKEEAEVWI